MKSISIFCAVVVAILSTTAHATPVDTVTMSHTGYGAKSTMEIWGGGHNSTNGYAGVYMFNKTGDTGEGGLWDNGALGGFCMDLAEIVSYSSSTYEVLMPQDGPKPNTFLGAPMGAEKADYLRELWGRYFDKAWAGTGSFTRQQKSNAESFAAAVWEIIYEELPASPAFWDVTSDGTEGLLGFRCKKADTATANNWLHSLNGTGPKANLYALSIDGKQDFLIAGPQQNTVPEPAAIGILGLGSLMLLCQKHKPLLNVGLA